MSPYLHQISQYFQLNHAGRGNKKQAAQNLPLVRTAKKRREPSRPRGDSKWERKGCLERELTKVGVGALLQLLLQQSDGFSEDFRYGRAPAASTHMSTGLGRDAAHKHREIVVRTGRQHFDAYIPRTQACTGSKLFDSYQECTQALTQNHRIGERARGRRNTTQTRDSSKPARFFEASQPQI